MSSPDTLRTLYPPIDATESGFLDVGDGHQIYWEQSGRMDGQPVLYVHGGPGGGCDEKNRQYFDPATYRIILFEQRGAGRSTPFASTDNNTTQHLLADMEALRQYLNIDQWLVFGGSWGSTLALLYAQAHAERVTGLILRGIFLGRQSEIDWLYSPAGPAQFYPQEWDEFLQPIPTAERGDLLQAYHRRLFGSDEKEQALCARAWSIWEGSLCRLMPDPEEVEKWSAPEFSLPLARLEAHYFVNRCFLADNQILNSMSLIQDIPARILHGRYDLVCPPVAAQELHAAWPGSELEFVAGAGHSASEPPMTDALMRATDAFRK